MVRGDTDKNLEEEWNDPPSWRNGIYVGDARSLGEYQLEYMIKREKNKIVDAYTGDYLRKKRRVKAE